MQRQAVHAQYSLRALWGWAVAALGAMLVLGGCASIVPGGDRRPPIVFVHGNGDDAAVWMTTIWRFESNGWPRNRLYAIDFPYPLARDDDTKPQPGRSSADDQMRYLSQQVDRVLAESGFSRVVLIGHSRGGFAIRNYIENGGGAKKVSHVILAATPNHGAWTGDFLPGSEFNGSGPFLSSLNAPHGPRELEVTPGPKWMTLRSDGNDKYAQSDGRWLGRPGFATGVDSSGPALKGARNIALGPVDHREAGFGPRAFEHMWRFLTGDWPVRAAIVPESSPVLDGRIFRPETNLPMAGVRIEIYEVAPVTGERLGAPLHARTTGEDGRWGPMPARPDAPYEFVVAAPGFATMHLYRSAFPRSSSLVQMHPGMLADAQKNAGSVVTMTRPRGYFDLQRDRMSLDGAPLPGVPPGVPGVSSATLLLPPGPPRTVIAEFNGERIAVRTWPAAANEAAVAELHY
ncbi:MAG: alpha/beta fold hydrolase [Burkholderiaceae bacterium]|nr:alpha/beta fold hydrolase [Burkholderiaceae bacterium]